MSKSQCNLGDDNANNEDNQYATQKELANQIVDARQEACSQ